jgi:antirestriction protein ArdC
MKADALMESIKGWVEQLAAELQEGQTQGFLAFLEKAGRFHRYSARNVLLIHQQRPEATLVAGVKRWNQLGRKVRKGEKGIAILAPSLKRVEVVDEATGEVREERKLAGFHTTYVFDITQTEGEPLEPQEEETPQGPALYERLRAACPVEVQEGLLPGGAMGKTDGKRIVLAAEGSATSKAETLLHEWAHTLLHFKGMKLPREVEELEAEAVAYAVGRELGLPMSTSRDYILSWQGTVEGLEASLERIGRAAREILERFHAAEPVLVAA